MVYVPPASNSKATSVSFPVVTGLLANHATKSSPSGIEVAEINVVQVVSVAEVASVLFNFSFPSVLISAL